jgi:serine/threonine protein kinase
MCVRALSESGITHRDLKPENVLLKSNVRNSEGYDVIKIADFGLSSLKVGVTHIPSHHYRRRSFSLHWVLRA